jgi:hypothetical protein
MRLWILPVAVCKLMFMWANCTRMSMVRLVALVNRADGCALAGSKGGDATAHRAAEAGRHG